MPAPTLLLRNMLSRLESDNCRVQLSNMTVIFGGSRMALSMDQRLPPRAFSRGMVTTCELLLAASTAAWMRSVSVPWNWLGVMVVGL